MKKYVLKLSGENITPYIRGVVTGIIDAMTGIPDKQYPSRQYPNGHCEIFFVATESQCNDILKALDKRYIGVIEYEVVFEY